MGTSIRTGKPSVGRTRIGAASSMAVRPLPHSGYSSRARSRRAIKRALTRVCLLHATGSSVLGPCLNPISETLRHSAPLREAIYSQPQANLAGWRALLPWLINPALTPISEIIDAFATRDEQSLVRLDAVETVV